MYKLSMTMYKFHPLNHYEILETIIFIKNLSLTNVGLSYDAA